MLLHQSGHTLLQETFFENLLCLSRLQLHRRLSHHSVVVVVVVVAVILVVVILVVSVII